MRQSTQFDPDNAMLGGFTSTDGTIAFFNRVNSLLTPDLTVLDIGAGRGAWSYQDACQYRRSLMTLRGKVREFICADIDAAVMSNPTSDRNVLIKDGRVPLEDESVDMIISDFVLEHITDVPAFVGEISRLLKPGGYFCARTPHRLHYVSLGARLIRNASHTSLLRHAQPGRQAQDVFPTAYRMNSRRQIRDSFAGWTNYTYIHTSEPRYYFGSRSLYGLLSFLHAISPAPFTGNLFVFLKKP